MITNLFIYVALLTKLGVKWLCQFYGRRFRSYPTDDVCNMLLNVIFLYLSEESKDNLKNQGIGFS
jgi:hypothetical protein